MQSQPSDSVRAKKHLGQHFLTSEDIARSIVEAGEVTKGDTVLEIGPGTGMLTKQLLHTGANVIAIEKDEECIPKLHETFKNELESGQFTLIQGDVRQFTPENKPYKLIANIPYYITGEIIRTFLEREQKPTAIALLIQKEVADRIARSEKESLLSLSVKAFGAPKYVKTVKAGSFFPKPKVDSAILSISDISNDFFKDIDEKLFFEVLHKAFSEKRKQVGKTLGTYIEKENLPVDPTTRPEDISLSDWKKIVSLMHK
ncbi:MAG: 16S rRNA (adenine(1518)-N(6)/adenine(1519)-N(6))-dimethyltransferase RsmA [Patescibacteria group bacterium UBA2103]